MDVQGVGPGPAGAELSRPLRALPELKGPGLAVPASLAESGDTTSALLRELSQPEVLRFLEILELPAPPQMAARIEELIRASVSAALEGNVQQALAKLAEVAALEP